MQIEEAVTVLHELSSANTAVVVGCSPLGNIAARTVKRTAPGWKLAGVLWLDIPEAESKDAWVSFDPKTVGMFSGTATQVRHIPNAIKASDVEDLMFDYLARAMIAARPVSDSISIHDAGELLREVMLDVTVDWKRDLLRPTVIIQCWWSGIFPRAVLDLPKKYCLGIHPTPLRFGMGRGAAALNNTIMELHELQLSEFPLWENTLFVMQPTPDTGAIFQHEDFSISYRDTISTLLDKVNYTSSKMILRGLQSIALGNDAADLVSAPTGMISSYKRRNDTDGEIKVDWEACKALGYVRALTHPYSGAWLNILTWDYSGRSRRRSRYRDSGYTFVTGITVEDRFRIWEAEVVEERSHERKNSGVIVGLSREGILLKMTDDCLLLKRVGIRGYEFWGDEFAEKVGWQVGVRLSIKDYQKDDVLP